MEYNLINQIGDLKHLKALERLYLHNNLIENVKNLKVGYNLRELHLGDNPVPHKELERFGIKRDGKSIYFLKIL